MAGAAAAGPPYAAPAGTRPAASRPGAESVLPGGRLINPLGLQFVTGPGTFGLAVSAAGKIVAAANSGPDRSSLTIINRQGRFWRTRQMAAHGEDEPEGGRAEEDSDWRGASLGAAFDGEHTLYLSEGNSGRVRAIDPLTGRHKVTFDLNQSGFRDSYTGDLALDAGRGVLYVLDQANFRLVAIDTRKPQILGSVRVGRLPFAIALSADGRRAYVTNSGMFEYRAVAGADPARAAQTGLLFPPFGFPSPEATRGARAPTAMGSAEVPGLGDPNAPESNSLAIVDLANPAQPRVEKYVRTGLPFGGESLGGSSPSGVAAANGLVFVSNAHNDSISVVDGASGEIRATIPLRIPGLEALRGVVPVGLAYCASRELILVAEAGINAVGIVNARDFHVLGHVPAGWFPARVAIDHETVWVANAKGHGTGPNSGSNIPDTFQNPLRRGSISMFPVPEASELDALTERVMANNGFVARQKEASLPKGIRYVVLIAKESRTFDEVLGDLSSASNGAVAGAADIARFGTRGNVIPDRRALKQRIPALYGVNVTPNHHGMAAQWAFSDNFYADSETGLDGHHWLAGSYPDAWTESSAMASGKDFRLRSPAPGRLIFPGAPAVLPEEQPEAGALWHHLERNGISFRSFGEGIELPGWVESDGAGTGARYLTNAPLAEPLYRNASHEYPQFNMNIPDQHRASGFIAEIERRYVEAGEPLPRFIFLRLPQDHGAHPRPEDGYPYTASYMADNDYALGRVVEYLSNTKWWKEMAIFVTEASAQGWVDHIDSHRTLLLVASPWAKKNYASHVNTSFPGLLKTVFRLLGAGPLNLYDAAASDLAECFAAEPDFTAHKLQPVDPRVFDPAKAREPRPADAARPAP
jgi:DNA-binding beta-propeller fold protein YncE